MAVGLDSANARALENERLLEYGFRRFRNYSLMTEGEEIEHASVWLGEEPTVPLVVARDIKLSLSDRARRAMKVKLTYQSPLPAPIVAGETGGCHGRSRCRGKMSMRCLFWLAPILPKLIWSEG